jgi:hypothetical protein
MADRLIDLLDTARNKYYGYEAAKDHRMRTAKTEAEFDAEVNTYETRHSFYARELRNNGVEIPVRCKDCKHFGGHGACHCHAADENGTPIFVREDDFCSYGERRSE